MVISELCLIVVLVIVIVCMLVAVFSILSQRKLQAEIIEIQKRLPGSSENIMELKDQLTKAECLVSRLREQVIFDTLTGAHTRAHLNDMLDVALARSKRGARMALFFLDIDLFKDINDKEGHDVGDKALVLFTAALKSELRTEDLVFRFGGDEFCIIINLVDLKKIKLLSEKIIDAVRQIKLEGSDGLVDITSSVGVTIIAKSDTDTKQILKRSDDALYHAKENGRNCAYLLNNDSHPILLVDNI